MKIVCLCVSLLMLSFDIYAASATAKIDKINVGGNGRHGTFISLVNKEFSECTSDSSTVKSLFMNGDSIANPNYKEQLSIALAAKMADKDIIVMYTECDGSYPLVSEVV